MRQLKYITVISNISVEPFFVPIVQRIFCIQNENIVTMMVPYEEYQEKEYLQYLQEAEIVIVWLNLEVLIPDIHNGSFSCICKNQKTEEIQNLCQDMAEYTSLHSNAKIFWLLFEDYFLHLSVATGHSFNLLVTKLNQRLQENLSNQITFIDLKYLIAELGIGHSFSEKNKFRWNYPYSTSLSQTVANEVQKQYFIENGISKKCLVLDCDNVLWGGILSEDGIENIRLGGTGFGREYQEFQRFVLSLYYRGVILAICSKNDLADVLCVFREHSGMILKEEHIACFQVNWENKLDNIRRIAAKLNIGTDSIVFVDDSSFEIEAVKSLLPEVIGILYQRTTVYKDFSCFNLKERFNPVEVAKRNDTYRTEMLRQEIKEACNSYQDYIAMLNMNVDIHEALPTEYARIVELTQRTNKCTNGIRCTMAEINEWTACKEVYLYTVMLTDKFSDIGLVGVFGVKTNKLILFSLSCRALGRGVEDIMLCYIKKRFGIKSFDFNNTGKNENLKMLIQSFLD